MIPGNFRGLGLGLAMIMSLFSYDLAGAQKKSSHWKMKCEILNNVNAYRFQRGKSCLVVNHKLQKAAQGYANWFARNMTKKSGVLLGHRADGRTPLKRAKAAGYKPLIKKPRKVVKRIRNADGSVTTRTTIYKGKIYNYVGENVLYFEGIDNCKTNRFAGASFKGWKGSKVHRINMLSGSWNATGIGVAMNRANKRCFGVQLFGIAKTGRNKACQIDCSAK